MLRHVAEASVEAFTNELTSALAQPSSMGFSSEACAADVAEFAAKVDPTPSKCAHGQHGLVSSFGLQGEWEPIDWPLPRWLPGSCTSASFPIPGEVKLTGATSPNMRLAASSSSTRSTPSTWGGKSVRFDDQGGKPQSDKLRPLRGKIALARAQHSELSAAMEQRVAMSATERDSMRQELDRQFSEVSAIERQIFQASDATNALVE
eukprot:CAMPEP_0178437198 /NCGR_PEP_ID=MMETSP0689_2-20121128/34849_1 /TAXON_ID=160604 /ORGANISM="Amphidinium massartii, Strain CS-259" /LENGTH=205 /DNA_ID=CAMNT_0020059353 /DNA_START=188 /DNA_END=805 /DNA_ORIENTATION=+